MGDWFHLILLRLPGVNDDVTDKEGEGQTFDNVVHG